ncbi:MAG TPA: retroviral-like aspartic protease family protein [Allosphingosinicella sp.]|jgi:aspartyl protease family protein
MAGSASLLWVAAGLVGLVTVAPELDRALEPGGASHSTGFAIARAPDGQFYTEAKAGDVPLRLLVDPGAETVLLSGEDAARMGLEVKPGFTPVTLPAIAVGPYEVQRVEAVIAPDLPVSLLGRSFLSRLAAVDVERERMVLR